MFFCCGGNKFITNENESEAPSDVFTAETDRGPNRLSSSQELPVSDDEELSKTVSKYQLSEKIIMTASKSLTGESVTDRQAAQT